MKGCVGVDEARWNLMVSGVVCRSKVGRLAVALAGMPDRVAELDACLTVARVWSEIWGLRGGVSVHIVFANIGRKICRPVFTELATASCSTWI
jgi:hypothetical protein